MKINPHKYYRKRYGNINYKNQTVNILIYSKRASEWTLLLGDNFYLIKMEYLLLSKCFSRSSIDFLQAKSQYF